MQIDDQERTAQQGDPPQTDSEAPHGALTDADSSQPAGEERPTCGSPFDEEGAGTGGAPSESNTGPPLRMQSLLKQVRSQIRAQPGLSLAKTGLLDLMQQIKDREAGTASLLNGLSGGGGGGGGGGAGVSEAGGEGGTLTNGEQGETEPEATEPPLPSTFEEELEATRITLRGEFEEQISQLRVEMQAYADRAVSDMEGKMRNAPHPLHAPAKGRSREQTDSQTADKKQKPLAAAAAVPALTGRRSRVLTRTMTTIVTKTCPPVIVGPRAKSETLHGCRDSGSLQMRESDLRFFHPQGPGRRPPPGRRALPPVIQPVHQPGPPRQKPVWTMAQTGR